MATNQLKYGAIQIYHGKVLGVGSYGKVCKAKYGQLPCAAKLLHDTMFEEGGDPGIHKYTEQFEQECRFLSRIKHPNIVQYLGTSRDPSSQRLALLMELMDESLTKFLERSTGSTPYHIQLNICHDVALALSYLHSNAIIHRDLSSNNVLLIGEGSRAKVTDFGMSKLTDVNPRMTPLTQCPGASVYMPPEALTNPPHYSSKLDCFSHGVLTIQIVTRKFPSPENATTTVEDLRFPTGRVVVFVPETERRKKDIDLIKPDHPLLPIALHCLKDRDTERPSADEVCERLAILKRESMYAHSVEQTRDQASLVHRLQEELVQKNHIITQSQTDHQNELAQKERDYQTKFEQEKTEYQNKLAQKKREHQAELEREKTKHQNELELKGRELQKEKDDLQIELEAKDCTIEQLLKNSSKSETSKPEINSAPEKIMEEISSAVITPAAPVKISWRQGESAPEGFTHTYGSAVYHANTAHFSKFEKIYSVSTPEYKWTKLPPCKYQCFGMAVINGQLTTVGGRVGYSNESIVNTLATLLPGEGWKEIFPPMPTQRRCPAVVTTHTHLVVAGGMISSSGGDTDVVEVLDTNTLQWSTAKSLPQLVSYPQMTLHNGQIYHADHVATFFSCSMQDLLESCRPTSANSSDGATVWTRLADIPAKFGPSLITLRVHILAIGGSDDSLGEDPTAAILCYNRTIDSWSEIGQLPTPCSDVLTAVLPSDEVIVVGGYVSYRQDSNDVYLGRLH